MFEAGAVKTGDCSASLVVVVRRERGEEREISLVIRRRESDPVNTKPGDGCCGERTRSPRGAAGVEGTARLAVD